MLLRLWVISNLIFLCHLTFFFLLETNSRGSRINILLLTCFLYYNLSFCILWFKKKNPWELRFLVHMLFISGQYDLYEYECKFFWEANKQGKENSSLPVYFNSNWLVVRQWRNHLTAWEEIFHCLPEGSTWNLQIYLHAMTCHLLWKTFYFSFIVTPGNQDKNRNYPRLCPLRHPWLSIYFLKSSCSYPLA